ncbi:GGDEF domain-containing protein [Cohnella boryungensis]|uniref:GGDEF domain-containing protein n=1 Tax=Cohnella boryungensis TaxID=768479 RepID=A0ABV8SJF0_9BACL
MKSRFRLKLTLALLLFSLLISTTLVLTDHLRVRKQMIQNTEEQLELNEKQILRALDTIDKAYYLFGEDTAEDMKKASYALRSNYERSPDLEGWDFEALKRTLGFDIYMIDERNTITYSSFPQDRGMNFNECCGRLAKILDERRASGEFFHDGIDLEQNTGLLKKYSYLATADKKYIIQLGFSLSDNAIFREFNFFDTIDELNRSNPSFNAIHVLNTAGWALGGPSARSDSITGERRSAFERTLASGETTEWRGRWENEPAVYRYVNYASKYDAGSTRSKVVEIIYNEKNLQQLLKDNRRMFAIKLLVISLIAMGLSLLIARWVAKPMHMAFHDSLTGLKNRAAFEEMLPSVLKEQRTAGVGLLMIDLDNFKAVNDRLGHDRGDHLLRSIASGIQRSAGKSDVAFRLGGDEFVLLLPSTTPDEAIAAASRVLSFASQSIHDGAGSLQGEITVSIGIALASESGLDAQQLCKNADIAMYESKAQGKNRYFLYSPPSSSD